MSICIVIKLNKPLSQPLSRHFYGCCHEEANKYANGLQASEIVWSFCRWKFNGKWHIVVAV